MLIKVNTMTLVTLLPPYCPVVVLGTAIVYKYISNQFTCIRRCIDDGAKLLVQ